MRKIKYIAKRTLLLLVSCVVPMTLMTGCDFAILGSVHSYVGGMSDRFDDTLDIAESLMNSGFISQDTFDDIEANIKRLEDDIDDMEAGITKEDVSSISDGHEIIQDAIGVDDSDGRSIYSAISALRPLGGTSKSKYNTYPGDGKIYGTDGEAEEAYKGKKGKDASDAPLKWKVLSNYIMANNDSGGDLDLWSVSKSESKKLIEEPSWICAKDSFTRSDVYCQDATFTHSNGMDCHPIEIVPNDLVEELNNKFEYQVYVINPDIYQNYGNSSEGYNNSFDAMAWDLKGAIDSNDTTLLDKYFSPAKDDKGNVVTLKTILNNNGVSNAQIDNLVCDSEFYTTEKGSGLELEMVGSGEDAYPVQKVGHDILVTHELDGDEGFVGIAQIRVKEFNYDTAELINSVLGIFSNEDLNSRFKVISTGDAGGRVYLVEYPVYSMNSFDVKSSSGSTVTATPSYALSGIGINFAQGHIVNYAEENGVLTYKSTIAGKGWGYTEEEGDLTESQYEMYDVDMYYTSSLFGDDPKNSSFVVAGKSALAMGLDGKKFKVGDSEKTIQKDSTLMCPRIVLRDYIEATYAPELTNDLNVAAFGRKVRFSITEYIDKSGNISYPNNESIAFYVDMSGNKLPTSSFLKLSDFCDLNSLTNSNKVKKIVDSGKQPGSIPAVEKTANSKPLISELACDTVGTVGSTVNPFTMFPGPKLGTDDYANFESGSIRQRMWAVCVYGGIYDTNLLTDWIDSDNPTASLDWWNNFLKSNGFGYNLSKQEISNYINKEYAAQIASVTGNVVISLDTINDIGNIYEKEDNIKTASAIRTLFLIIGWVLMIYSLLIMLCWGMDTNTDLGLGLTEKVTLGHWTAVKYASDVPQGDTGEHSYLAFGSLMIRCAILIVVGILLINLDIFKLVSLLIGLFGKAASAIEDLIKGN